MMSQTPNQYGWGTPTTQQQRSALSPHLPVTNAVIPGTSVELKTIKTKGWLPVEGQEHPTVEYTEVRGDIKHFSSMPTATKIQSRDDKIKLSKFCRQIVFFVETLKEDKDPGRLMLALVDPTHPLAPKVTETEVACAVSNRFLFQILDLHTEEAANATVAQWEDTYDGKAAWLSLKALIVPATTADKQKLLSELNFAVIPFDSDPTLELDQHLQKITKVLKLDPTCFTEEQQIQSLIRTLIPNMNVERELAQKHGMANPSYCKTTYDMYDKRQFMDQGLYNVPILIQTIRSNYMNFNMKVNEIADAKALIASLPGQNQPGSALAATETTKADTPATLAITERKKLSAADFAKKRAEEGKAKLAAHICPICKVKGSHWQNRCPILQNTEMQELAKKLAAKASANAVTPSVETDTLSVETDTLTPMVYTPTKPRSGVSGAKTYVAAVNTVQAVADIDSSDDEPDLRDSITHVVCATTPLEPTPENRADYPKSSSLYQCLKNCAAYFAQFQPTILLIIIFSMLMLPLTQAELTDVNKHAAWNQQQIPPEPPLNGFDNIAYATMHNLSLPVLAADTNTCTLLLDTGA